MSDKTINKKRLAKNTFMLYIRMLLVMAVTFFTTRVVLDKLGVSDYGIYNTIAGVVVMFAFINKAMVTTTQRFLNFYLGKGDLEGAKKNFSISLLVHVAIGLLMIVLTEGLGLWFLNCKMSFPTERYDAAFWTLQLSILITFLNILRTPYNACIIAYEKMNFYAYVSIAEVILKLLIVYALTITQYDRLIVYNILHLFISVSLLLVYKIYCNYYYTISRFDYIWDKNLFKSLLNFSGFSLLGNAANIGATHGISLILNTFVGVVANASVGVSNQIKAGIYAFITSFQIAFNPQIVKSYAQQEFEPLRLLVYQTSRFSYYLMLLLSLPVLVHCQDILDFWLKEVPTFAHDFCVWTILTTLILTLEEPLWIVVQASGNIKKYQIFCSIILLANLPIACLLLKLGFPPVYVYISRFILNIGMYIFRFCYVKPMIGLNTYEYIKKLFQPLFFVTLTAVFIVYAIKLLELHFIISSILMIMVNMVVIGVIGVNSKERSMIFNILRKR